MIPVPQYILDQIELDAEMQQDVERSKIEKRFWEKVDCNGPIPSHRPELGRCWLWTGGDSSSRGYGALKVNSKKIRAHILSWRLRFGSESNPNGLDTCHKCDNPCCVNPEHLFLGTEKDNVRDCMEKGRRGATQGANNGRAVINAEMVRKIRFLAAEYGSSQIAKEIGTTRNIVRGVLSGRTWRHVK